jgi:hypothetical protein
VLVWVVNEQPFTGTYNGGTYENGILKSVVDTTEYKVVNGVLLFNGPTIFWYL